VSEKVDEPWGHSRPDNYFDIDAWRKNPMQALTPIPGKDGLVLTEHSVGADEDTNYVQVTLTNNGPKEVFVLPITPMHYQFQAKLVPDGTVEALVALPPVDPPLPDESTLVKLYPRNSISAIFGLKKSWRRKNATYRVIAFGQMQLMVDGKPTLVPFDVKSNWSPGK
jgi:hypothetical protein